MKRIPRTVLFAVAIVSIFRLLVAAHVPLTEDEAYYWVWSRHPAFGYLDHPPMVAWLIGAASYFGNSPLAVRFPFVVCEALAALFAGAAAVELSERPRAGAAACIAVLLLPQIRFALGEALPDPPFLCFWALALWSAAVLRNRPSRLHTVALGVALGGALLSRIFGWALVAGIAGFSFNGFRNAGWARRFLLPLAIGLAAYVPFVLFDAAHDWQNVRFTFVERHSMSANYLAQAGGASTVRFLLLAAVLAYIAYRMCIRRSYPLLAWTAIPLIAALGLLSPFEKVETYWLFGPMISLCVGAGIAFDSLHRSIRRALQALYYATAVAVAMSAAVTALPERMQYRILNSPVARSGSLYDSVYMWPRIAPQIADLSHQTGAAIVTDVFETHSELTYYGIPALFVGSDSHARQWLRWNSGVAAPARALYVRSEPSDRESETLQALSAAYARAVSDSTIFVGFAGENLGGFRVTVFSQPRPGAAAALWPSR